MEGHRGLLLFECHDVKNNKLVSITKQANGVKDSQKYYELTPPKTSKSIRTLPLTNVKNTIDNLNLGI